MQAADDWGARAARWRGIRSATIDVCGTDVHLLRTPASGAPGQPQLLVHGLGGSASNWLEVMRGLSRFGEVVAVDLPGFGRTRPPADRAARLGANTRFLDALMDSLGWESAAVHGNSMGGTLTALFAGRFPDRVERLVLVAPALSTDRRRSLHLDTTTLRRFAPFVVPHLGEFLSRRTIPIDDVEGLWNEAVHYVHADPSRIAPELDAVGLANLKAGFELPWRSAAMLTATKSLVGTIVGRRALERTVERITAPTLVVWGDRDRLVARAMIDRVTARRPDWQLAVIEGSGHVPMMEVPDQFLDVVVPWLRPSSDVDSAHTG